MAINFPNSPSDGDIFGNYTYDDSIPGWRKTPENSASLPAGTIVQWPRATAPANWLICDGAAISRTEYASLFAAIGVQYGAGNGTTTFNLPNLKGRVAVGFDASQSEFDVLGEVGGAKTHTLTASEIPSHTHTFSGSTGDGGSHTHTISVTGGAHTHNLPMGASGAPNGVNDTPLRSSGGPDGNFRTGFESSGSNYGSSTGTHTHSASASTVAAHTHTYSGTTGSAGSGSAHNNLQPYIVLNYIIKTSAGITSGDSELATRVGVVENQNNLTPMSYNYIINGAFDIWQRGTSFSASGYTADRWTGDFVTGAGTVSRQSFTPGSAPVAGYEGQFFLRRSVTTGAQFSSLIHRVEDVRTLSGQTVTLSFWAKGTNPTGNFSVVLIQNFGSGGSSDVVTGLPTLTLTGSWVRYTATVTLPSMSGKTIGANSFLWLSIYQAAANTSASTLDIWGVQLEEGSYATPFRRNAPSIQAELAACQRYYQISGMTSVFASNTTDINSNAQFVVEMRATPTASVEGNGRITVGLINIADYTQSAANIYMFATTRNAFFVFGNFSGLTANRPYAWKSNGNQILLNAEI